MHRCMHAHTHTSHKSSHISSLHQDSKSVAASTQIWKSLNVRHFWKPGPRDFQICSSMELKGSRKKSTFNNLPMCHVRNKDHTGKTLSIRKIWFLCLKCTWEKYCNASQVPAVACLMVFGGKRPTSAFHLGSLGTSLQAKGATPEDPCEREEHGLLFPRP